MKKIILLLTFMACIGMRAAADGTTPLMGWGSWNTYWVNISDLLHAQNQLCAGCTPRS